MKGDLWRMQIEELNGPLFELEDNHPAKKFLMAFIDCLTNCVGRQYDFGQQTPVEQEWESATDGRIWTFSGFVYAFLCFDIVLDGLLENASYLTASEVSAIDELPLLRSMMNECADAARECGNSEIIVLADQVLNMLGLWDQYLSYRRAVIGSNQP
jgi:hypothetical protein